MSAHMPVVFVSHGAPDALLKAPEAVACWRDIGQAIPRPTAILAISAHWEARQATASLSGAPKTLHDFSGFEPALHAIQYPAPGAPALAERVVSLLTAAGSAADLHPSRGLDHGVWVPLLSMVPQADVPVTQLSLVRNAGPATHFALGLALTPLRKEGVLIVATGSITHNFDWLAAGNPTPVPQAKDFADWIAAHVAAQDVTALLDYRSSPHGSASHPTEAHLLPFFVALGAADGDRPTRYQPPFSYGGLAMDAYVWRDPSDTN